MPTYEVTDPIDVLEELPSESALADARQPRHGHKPRAVFFERRVEQLLDQAHLALAPDEGRLQPVHALRAADGGDDLPGGEQALRLRLAFQGARSAVDVRHGSRCQRARRL